MSTKPALPKGTRDFSPAEMNRRMYIMDILRKAFQRFGYQPIETPSFENLQTLTGKYGEEGDRLIFKILKSGDFAKKVNEDHWADKNAQKLTSQISDKALRYDLTVPFARYVVQHQNDITFPFKRYQMQPVWRADRPQKGRFREFYQCDADVVGSNSLLQEVELIQLYDDVFTSLGIDTNIKLNNRKVLAGIAQSIGHPDKLIDFTIALDKLDKIGKEGVIKEWEERGLSADAIEKLQPLFASGESRKEQLGTLAQIIGDNAEGKKGIEELEFIINQIENLGLQSAQLALDLTLARGLNYYTGAILEVVANDVEIGSIGGGGRYDDLTGIFGLKNLSGVGISFGLDRIYLVVEELNKFPANLGLTTQVLFANYGDAEAAHCMKLLQQLRKAGISAEIYPDAVKMKKQFDYAEKNKIPFLAIVGSREIETNTINLKNLASGEQENLTIEEVITTLK